MYKRQGPDGTPNTADDTYVDDGYVMGTNPTALPSGLAPIAVDQYFSDPNRLTIFPLKGTYQQGSGTAPGGGTTPPSGGGMTWKVYQVSSLADLNMIKDPGHNEPNWGTWPITVALFQQGPTWRIQKVSKINNGQDAVPDTPDDEYGDDGYVMGTNPTALPSGLAPIAVDQYFSDPNRLTIFPLKGTYQQGSGTAPGGGTTPPSGGGMTWKVYQVSSLADLNMIKDPGHNEPNWGTWPITVAVFQQGPTWRIQKVRNSGPGPDGTPNTPVSYTHLTLPTKG